MSQQPFGDIPLFREIQRLLQAGGGPVNFELARQVAAAIAGQSGDPSAAAFTADLPQLVASTEGPLAGFTRLQPQKPARTKLLGRAEWASETLTAWRWLLEGLAVHFTSQLSKLGGDDQEQAPVQTAMAQIGPLLLGIQAGTLIGHLAGEVLGRYDLPIPRDDDERLLFVGPNLERVASDYSFDPGGFKQWIALRDGARHLVATSIPWWSRYLRSLLEALINSVEIDASDLERRLVELQTKGVEGLNGDYEAGIPIVQSAEHAAALRRVQSFVAAFDGYTDRAASVISAQLGLDVSQIEEGMARREASPTQGEAILNSLLGLSIDPALQTAGLNFTAAVTELKGIESLNRMWEAPDNLPTQDELKDPFLWMERVLE